MYPELGNTGIEMYGLFNTIAMAFFYIYNFTNFRKKRSLPSNFSLFAADQILRKNKFIFLAEPFIWTCLEIVIISYIQFEFLLGSFHGVVANIFNTGSNYFGTLFLKPLVLYLFFYLIAVNPLKQMDLITPAYPLALIFAKLACLFHGCCSGFECSWGYYNQRDEIFEFPTQLVEAALALLLFIFLLWYKKRAKEGTLFPIYLILFSATRFFSEFTRSEENILGPFKTYHFLCIAGVIIGIIELLIVLRYSEKIKQLYNRNPFPWIKEKNIVHHNSKKKRNDSTYTLWTLKKDYSNFKMWAIIWTLGLIGQISWNVEGAWFNTFVYEKIDKNPSIITPMLILSALATTISIFFFGTLTDRTGNRRTMISTGFIVWGILTACFSLTQFIVKSSLMFAVICIVFIDMLLSFFGSMCTDVGYSAWLTDIMNDKNRGQIGGAIAIQSVLGSLLANVLGGFLVGKENNYIRLFVILGAFISVFGIVSIFLFSSKNDVTPSVRGSFLKQFLSIFNIKLLFKHKELLLVYVSVAVFFIGYNTYMPHLGNFFIQYIGFTPEQVGVINAIPLLFSIAVTLPVSKYINNGKYVEVLCVSIISGLAGILPMVAILPEDVDTTKNFHLKFFISVFLVGVSYIIMLQSTKSWTKNLCPKDSKGQFEGLYAISFALIPMIFGSNIGEAIVKTSGETIFNELTGRYEYIPNGKVFLVGVIISTLSIIPILLTKKYSNRFSDNKNI